MMHTAMLQQTAGSRDESKKRSRTIKSQMVRCQGKGKWIMLEMNAIALDYYRILGIAGKGGMGRVYHAVDIRDNSHWAIKEDLSADSGFQLFDEAEVLASLDHPALPKTRGVLRWEGSQYMLMQYIEGDTLTRKLREQQKYPESQVLDWFIQICDVLCYLHNRPKPIVYRDLKPSNIIIDKQNRVRIIDFGIAEEYTNQNDGSQMQKSGLTKGYAAPEQYNRRFKADVRTDIYALGVTVHYLLTGKNPVKPPYEFLPVRKLSPEVSPAMEAIIRRCLQPNPDKRYKTADALYQDLTHIEEKNRVIRRKKQLRVMGFSAVAAAAVAIVLFSGGVLKNNRQKQIDAYYTAVEAAYQAAENGQFDTAIAYAERAVATQPEEISGHLTIGYCYMLQGEYDLCREYISAEILDRFPDCYNNTDFLHFMAQLYERSGNPQEALYYYQLLCTIAPDDPDIWFDLAQCHIRIGNHDDAKICLQTYLECGGTQAMAEELQKQLPNLEE